MYAIIDNYDSFTHNLYQYLRELTAEPVEVFRNDRISVDELTAMHPAGIVISPGPGRPEEAGISVEVIRRLAGTVPILGVCLGHQAIGHAFGARVVAARRIVHGKAEEMSLDGRGLFRGIPGRATFTRYHSLALEEASLPPELEVTARAADGEVMGVRHRVHVLEGIQFHPESIASEHGKRCLGNFLSYRREPFALASVLAGLQEGRSTSREEAEAFMDDLTDGGLSDIQIAGMLAALTIPLVNAESLAGLAAVLRRKKRVFASDHKVLDTCGTGGTAWAPSTSPRSPRWSRPPAARAWPSTATAGSARPAEARTSSASWASPWTPRPGPPRRCCGIPASVSCSRPPSTAPCATRPGRAPTWASRA